VTSSMHPVKYQESGIGDIMELYDFIIIIIFNMIMSEVVYSTWGDDQFNLGNTVPPSLSIALRILLVNSCSSGA